MTTWTPSTSTDERQALLDAALAAVREHGAQHLTVQHVLSAAGLGTRALYRHFRSKDHLVVAVFAEAARAEADRLRIRMPRDADPVAGVTAWIEGRLDLAFDADVQSDLQLLSRQAQSLYAVAPDTMAAVHAAMLAPLVDEIRRGADAGAFPGADPLADAIAIDAVTWAAIERQWAVGDRTRDAARVTVLTFCLRGLGAARP